MESKIACTNKYQKGVAWRYVYKLLCVNDKFSKSFKLKLGKFYNFINDMIEKSKYSSEVMKKHFNNELVITKEDYEDFENSTIGWIWDIRDLTSRIS